MLKRENKWLDLAAAFFLFVVFWVTALRLSATGWSEDLRSVRSFVVLGFLVGYLLGLSSFPRWAVFLIGGSYSVLLIPWVLGTGLDAEIEWGERLVSLSGRLQESFQLFVTNQPIQDYLLFVFSMAILFWLMSLVGGFQLSSSGKPWLALLVAGIVMVSIDISSPEVVHRGRYSGAWMLFALLSLGRLYFVGERVRWGRQGIAVDSDAGIDLGRSMAIIGLVLVLIAWNIPTAAGFLRPDSVPWWQFSQLRQRLQNLTAGLNVPEYSTADFSYSNELKLGSGTPLERVELFQVQASRDHPTGIPFYWRGQSYNLYTGDGWKNTITKEHEIAPAEWPVRELPLADRVEIELTYTIRAASLQTLYPPGQPQSVSRQAVWVGDSAMEGQVDLIAVKSARALLAGEVVRVETRLNDLTVARLRQAGDGYPNWVRERYLQLPEDFPETIRTLAENLTREAETPYDKARIITVFLRNEIRYEEQIPQLPTDQDVIEWFLFSHKAGFCNYYATSEVLMLRSLGIPARIAVGFVQGEPDVEKQNFYRVFMKDYHAWPEVYFPEIGWVQFEPTANQPAHSLRLGLADQLPDGNTGHLRDTDLTETAGRDPFEGLEDDLDWNWEDEAAGEGKTGLAKINWRWGAAGLTLLVGMGAGLIWWRSLVTGRGLLWSLPRAVENRMRRMGGRPPDWLTQMAERGRLTPLERMVGRIAWMLFLFGHKIEIGDTAAEQIAALGEFLDEDGKTVAAEFLEIIQKTIFSPHPAGPGRTRIVYLNLWRTVVATWVKGWRGV